MTLASGALGWILLLSRLICTTLASFEVVEHFNWATIQSSKELQYHKCYGSFECSKLEVPLDWSNLSNPNTISLAIVRLPAVVDVADESFGGTIVINPGGPGGSGVGFTLTAGKGIQKIVDNDNQHFEILSFDPRGIQFSGPEVACFHDNSARIELSMRSTGAGSLESSQYATDLKWGIDQAIGLACQRTNNGHFPDGSNSRQFVSTALVARDMVEIIDRVDADLQKELQLRGRPRQDRQKPMSSDSQSDPPLLNYWGFSYGTYLGNTFASMFPERIGRMVLDGVVDADDYAATGWTTNLQDNNKTWAKFFEYCHEAGSKCALFEPSIRGPEEIQAKVEAFLAELQDNPIPFVYNGNAYIHTYFDMKAVIHAHLYSPYPLWPLLALMLFALMEGDVSTAAAVWRRSVPRGFPPSVPLPLPPLLPIHTTPNGIMDNRTRLFDYPWRWEATMSVLCGDGDDITSWTKPDYAEYLTLLESQSPLVGSIWAEIILPCIHWPASVRPASQNRFTGPFKSNLTDYDSRGSPLLFIGNTADPVTPVRNAVKMSERHEGSVVLTQDKPGHCSGITRPNECVSEIVRAFFAHGTLPKPGLVCDGTRRPWDDL
ncbi:uncharacterized protein Z518_01332 [Rhinocladiella mackenziei CBS 650.93]|uniref:Rhinocladiella mackenziei CBS 650.93 unplaced genomic scaffold supercont1.1, whole genome shotgun sequence n=1 Tax=Rhinocladiella mackenziei CBS 650.93 TaxID=1442369 RepID=A0A0D2J3F4_9EURO|nr:uncharacterized protein Z518_01332 [Rhinocladiella mackenziei CBS 650.93]KIX10251.1 hypothetical protein Z518_01332 [Rhinocladiella mackenziei CBS 650.93]